MIEGHALDSWTRTADRDTDGYRLAILIAGIGAPLFLFLAGVALPLAAASRRRKGLSSGEITRVALRRGAWIFLLAFLFRLQSWVISGGPFPGSLLKVDILNVMGVALMAAALLWGAAKRDSIRISLFAAVTIAVAMVTPMVRTWPLVGVLPDPVESYIRPLPGSTTFTLFPWMGFLTAGAAAGVAMSATDPLRSRRLNATLLALGGVVASGGYAASFLPAIYDNTSFWTSSPTFFFVRLGMLLAAVPLADALTRLSPWKALQDFGRASLFVYWIHVEMAYGVLSLPLHRSLPFAVAVGAFLLFSAMLFGLVRAREQLSRRGRSPQASESGKSPSGIARSPAS
jgi:uncharacterized membrane protein